MTTDYLSNGGAAMARAIAAHESPQTTRLYDTAPATRSPSTRSTAFGSEGTAEDMEAAHARSSGIARVTIQYLTNLLRGEPVKLTIVS